MLKVHNTLSRSKEEFKPRREKKVGMYVCGPTVQGPPHIGHARTYVAFDFIRRYLEWKGFEVKYVMNITDVHDDIISKSNELGIEWKELAEKNSKLFFKELDGLHVKKADAYPTVSGHINEIIELVKKLEEKGIAYETDDGVYYDISKFSDYGKLSGVKMDKSKTGTRVDTDKYDKESVQDFVLWKKAKPGEPSWDSPWGKGRPGWHIECSAMSGKHLGEQIDVHGGAVDLVFPHHENEIAQSEGASGKKPFVKYWLHSGFLNVEGEKMSKSLGNYIEVPELLDKYNPKVFRFFVAGLHYRSRIDFSEKAMDEAKVGLERFNRLIEALQEADGKDEGKLQALVKKAKTAFEKAMDNDFDLPSAWAELYDFARDANKLLGEGKVGAKDAEQTLNFMKQIDEIFEVFSFEKEDLEISEDDKKLVEERDKARAEKNWAKADEIRDNLKEKGIELFDTPQGTKWKKAT